MENATLPWFQDTKEDPVPTMTIVKLGIIEENLGNMEVANVDLMEVILIFWLVKIILSGGFTYCTLSEGDEEFSQMKDKFTFIVSRGFYCHTLLRFGPCSHIYDDEYRDYQIAIRYFKQYPQLIFNDPCIQRNINYEFWRFAGGLKLVVSLPLLSGILVLFFI